MTYALIALNVVVFVFLQGIGTNEKFTYAFSTIPQEIRTGTDVAENVTVELGDQRIVIPLEHTPVSVYFTLLTSMFMVLAFVLAPLDATFGGVQATHSHLVTAMLLGAILIAAGILLETRT